MSAHTTNDIRREGHGSICSNRDGSLNKFPWSQEIVKKKMAEEFQVKLFAEFLTLTESYYRRGKKKKTQLASQPPAKLHRAFRHLIHSLLLHFQDATPRWETRRVETAECKGSEDMRTAPR